MSGKSERAKRRLMEQKMEEQIAKFDRVEQLVSDMNAMPDVPYFACNLSSELHTMECQGDCPTLTKWEVAIVHERARWRKYHNVEPRPDHLNGINEHAKLDAILSALVELGVDGQELDNKIKKNIFDELVRYRLEVIPDLQAKAAARHSQIQISRSMPNGPRQH